ncbi:hypothetical protein [Streptomyces rubradiris]|uniref:Uncharacterized protein n=1 Tax=Streptomyces rubradiris TaxID=285531 RepID=A0ABQ3RDI5_STRRR|nr:hypothetical protein [Streptomyces rubradiris]GHH29661.1 hypothetical protein GCM10018792_75080 [Streptomyces rubradiris]GHI53931.1 hypothetical protein Srubr_37770 [Streptomyces rubradiris]
MALHAREFFAELKLPFADSAVVGDTYYAAPEPGGPLRLRIDFTSTRWANQYDGLRLATVHQDRGDLDITILRFADHQTFRHRDSTRGVPPHHSDYGTIKEFKNDPAFVPWKGAHTSGLREAIEQYTSIWFPGTWTASAQKRTAGRTARVAPAPPAAPSTRRAR